MNPPNQPRPALKLKLSNIGTPQNNATPQTPGTQNTARTPSIKLKFGSKPNSASTTPVTANAPEASQPASKKRKRLSIAPSETGSVSVTKPDVKPPVRKLSLVQKVSLPPTQTPLFRLKTKGKVPKRALGVGYDSELEERENDPVVLEGMVLRMPPGPDADFIHESLQNGLVGVSRLQGGADIRLRMLDVHGRRGVLFVRGVQYAVTVVDLPTITEVMKSWDKKNFMKTFDVSQMCLVLGKCTTDEEARNFPLPAQVDSKNHQYADGLTAPMKNVKRRRFERTTRTRVDDIEAIERKVGGMLKADADAETVTYEVLDYDPRTARDQYSPVFSDADAEGEDDDYFGQEAGGLVETLDYSQAVEPNVTAEDVEDFARMFGDDDEDGGNSLSLLGNVPAASNALHPPDGADSSFAMTSASASPSATAAPTPAGQAGQSSDEDEEEEDEDADEERREGDDARQQIKDRIADLEQKIRDSNQQLKKTANQILRKKLAKKIQELQSDVSMMRKNAGLGDDGDEEE